MLFRSFNLREDPTESANVAMKHPEVVAKLAEFLRTQHAASAEFPLPALDKQ